MTQALRLRYYQDIGRLQIEENLRLFQVMAMAFHGGSAAQTVLTNWQIAVGWIKESVGDQIRSLRRWLQTTMDKRWGVVDQGTPQPDAAVSDDEETADATQ